MVRRRFPNTAIVPIIVIPSIHERGIAQQNALDCLREFEDYTATGFPIILVDNSRGPTHELLEQKYNAINSEVVNNLHKLINFDKSNRLSNMDIRDRLAMFSDPGVILLASAMIEPGDENPIFNGIKKAIEASPIIGDISRVIKRVAIQCECDPGVYTEKNIVSAQGYFKNVAGIFEGYYDPEDCNGTLVNRILVAISGTRIPDQLIRDREVLVEESFKATNMDSVGFKSNANLKSAWGGEEKPKEDESKATTLDMSDIFGDIETKRVK
jgi:hypothetical protein